MIGTTSTFSFASAVCSTKHWPPARRALGADAAYAVGRVVRERDRLAQLVGRLDPGQDDAVGADVQRPLDQPHVALGHAHQRHRVAAHGRAQVLDDLLPVEVPVLGVDDDPVEPQANGHLRDARALERHPQAVHRLVRGEFLTEFSNRGSFHRFKPPPRS
jgi:hypothetical protein